MLEYLFFIGFMIIISLNFMWRNKNIQMSLYSIYIFFAIIAATSLFLISFDIEQLSIIAGYLFPIFGFLSNMIFALFTYSFLVKKVENKLILSSAFLGLIYVFSLLIYTPFEIIENENIQFYPKLKPYAYIPSMILMISFYILGYLFFNFSKNAGKKRKYFIIFALCLILYNTIALLILIFEFFFSINILKYLVYFALLFSIIAIYSYNKITHNKL